MSDGVVPSCAGGSGTRPRVTLYTRPGCGLCDEAEATIREVACAVPLDLVKRNILDDLADYGRYKHDIPVILLGDVEIARHRISAAVLVAALDAARSP